MLRISVAVLLLCGSEARADLDAGLPDAGTTTQIAVLDFEANSLAQDQAPAVTSLVASELAAVPTRRVITSRDVTAALGLERQKQLLGGGTCGADCLVELSGAVGARYVVTGRIDRLGEHYVLDASVFDASKGVNLGRPRADARDSGDIPEAAHTLAKAIAGALGKGPAEAAFLSTPEEEATPFSLALKIGPQFFASLASLNPEGSLELGYRFDPEWVGFLQVGFSFVTTQSYGGGGLVVVPGSIGVRHLYRVKKAFQPYWGLGLGLQLSFGSFGFVQKTGPLPSLIGSGGFQRMIGDHFSVGFESSINLAQAALGVAQNNLGSGFNLDLAVILAYRF